MYLMLSYYMVFHQHVDLYAFINKLKNNYSQNKNFKIDTENFWEWETCSILSIKMSWVHMNMLKLTKIYNLTICSTLLESYTPITIKFKKNTVLCCGDFESSLGKKKEPTSSFPGKNTPIVYPISNSPENLCTNNIIQIERIVLP